MIRNTNLSAHIRSVRGSIPCTATIQIIPYGATSTYLQLAKNINNIKAVRAVAGANGANAIAIVIPCHRIIESTGGLGGYGGGLAAKKRLLKLEQNNCALSDDKKYEFVGSMDTKYDGSFSLP